MDSDDFVAQDGDGSVWCSVLLFGKGDMEQLVKWGHKSYNDPYSICSSCDCDRLHKPWTDLRREALWRASHPMPNSEYLARTVQGHPVRDSIYFNKHFLRYDLMHIMDHKGVVSVAAGSIINKLVKEEPRLGSRQDLRLAAINSLMKKFQDATRVTSRMPPLRLRDLVSSGWSELGGSLIKAANTRCMVPFLLSLAKSYFDTSGDQYHEAIINWISSINDFYIILYGADLFLTKEEKNSLQECLYSMGRWHIVCRQCANQRGELAFQVKPKAHYVQELGYQCRLLNARFVQCYQEESMMGVMARIFKKSCAGPYLRTVQRTVCFKYLVYWCVMNQM